MLTSGMFPYACDSYKEVLRVGLEAKKLEKPEQKFSFQGMAAHCGVQKTYLSKVINHDGHLNEDQLFDALDYLGCENEQIEFTILLANFEKCYSKKRRVLLAQKIAEVRQSKIRTEASLKVEQTQPEGLDLLEYYVDPIFQVLHMCLTIRKFQLNPGQLAELLRISTPLLRKYLRALKRMKIIDYQDRQGAFTKVVVVRDNLHLPHDSVLHDVYAARIRLKALEQAERLEKGDAYRFSVIFSTDRKTRDSIHSSFLTWLKGVQKSVGDGREEDVFQMNFDLLKWT